MSDHTYDDAPLWTVLDALARMNGSESRIIDLARKVKTRSGWPGAYRAIGRLTSAGYATTQEVADGQDFGPQGRRATVKLTALGLARWRAGAGMVRVDQVDRVNVVGGFGVVHRGVWVH